MKRKFFSLMVAACAALSSLTGFTGCSGGGDNNSIPGVVTLQDFASCRKEFCVQTQGLYTLTIEPLEEVIVDGAEEEKKDGTVKVSCLINGMYYATVSYCISEWENDLPKDGSSTGAGATSTGLHVSFTPGMPNYANISKDTTLLLTVGGNPSNETLVSGIFIGLKYSTMEVEVAAELSYVNTSNEATPDPKLIPGSFYVVKSK